MSNRAARRGKVSVENSPLLVFIAHRATGEGEACARWLSQRLNNRKISLQDDRDATIQTYLGEEAPPLGDWTEKWKGDLRTARGLILICSSGTGKRNEKVDWLYEEIDWWVKNRKSTPPIVVLVDGKVGNMPASVRTQWPKTQWVSWSPADDKPQQDLLADRITEGLRLSEVGIRYQELRRLTVRNRSLAMLGVIVLLLGVLSYFLLGSQIEQRRLAERNLQLSYGPTLQEAYTAYRAREFRQMKDRLLAVPPAIRGFEWKLLRNLADQSATTWEAPAKITDLDYSPNGRFLAMGMDDGNIIIQPARLYTNDRESAPRADWGHIGQTIPQSDGKAMANGAPARVTALAFYGPNDLATTGFDGHIRLWQADAAMESTMNSPTDTIRGTLAVSPDGNWVASGTANGFVHVWRVAHRSYLDPQTALAVNSEPVALAFSPDSKILLVAESSLDPNVQAWDWQANRRLAPLPSDQKVKSFALLGEAVYGGRADGSIVRWDLQTREVAEAAPAGPRREAIDRLRPAPGGRKLGGMCGKRVFLLDVITGAACWVTGAEENVSSFGFHPNENTLVTASGKTLRTYDLSRSAAHTDLPDLHVALDVSADGKSVVTYSTSHVPGPLRVWNTVDRTFRDIVIPFDLTSAAIFPDGSKVAGGWEDGTIRCYRTLDGGPEWTARADSLVSSIAVTPDGGQLVTGAKLASESVATVWNAANGNRIASFPGRGVAVISAKGRAIATEGVPPYRDTSKPDLPAFQIFCMPDWRELTQGPPRPNPIRTLAIDTEGKRVVTIGPDVEVWSLTNPPQLLRQISLLGKRGEYAAFSPNDPSRLIVGVEGALTFWNIDTGDLLLRMDADDENEFDMAKWVDDRIFAANKFRVTMFQGNVDGIEDWEAEARRLAEVKRIEKMAEESRSQHHE